MSRILVGLAKLNAKFSFKQHSQKQIHEKKKMHKKCWLIQFFLESINSNSFSIVNIRESR